MKELGYDLIVFYTQECKDVIIYDSQSGDGFDLCRLSDMHYDVILDVGKFLYYCTVIYCVKCMKLYKNGLDHVCLLPVMCIKCYLIHSKIECEEGLSSTCPLCDIIFYQLKASLKAKFDPKRWTDSLPMVLLGLGSMYKEDLQACTAELVYSTTLCLPGQFFDPHSHESMEPTSDLVTELNQTM